MLHQVNLDNIIKLMLELKNTEKRALTEQEKKCEQIYNTTHLRNEDGRYIVKLPTKSENLLSTQGERRKIALGRLNNLERRLEKNYWLKTEYTKYRNILVSKEDRDYQRVLWRKNINQPVKDYHLLRVIFGTGCAPYLAVKTLMQIAEDEGKESPNAVRSIKEDFFMDDLVL